MSGVPPRLKAAVADELLVALIFGVLAAMALQTGVVAVLAVPAGRLATPAAESVGASPAAATAGGLAVASWMAVRLAVRVLGTGSPSGQTPGKRLAGLRVVDTNGAPPGYRVAAVREAVLAVELLTVVGLAGTLLDPPLHDRVAATRQEPAAQ